MNREFAFNKTLEEETKQMSTIADTILRRKQYQEKYNNRLVIDEQDDDPRIHFFNQCLKDQNLCLPILDKIWKKTLCLQNYFLSEGNIRGLA